MFITGCSLGIQIHTPYFLFVISSECSKCISNSTWPKYNQLFYSKNLIFHRHFLSQSMILPFTQLLSLKTCKSHLLFSSPLCVPYSRHLALTQKYILNIISSQMALHRSLLLKQHQTLFTFSLMLAQFTSSNFLSVPKILIAFVYFFSLSPLSMRI